MSSGGSNYSTGTTGGGPMTARIESPISKGPNAPQGGMSVPVDSFSSPAPGGKGGFPSAQSPYAQQQPQMYMPPQQPSMYQQAFPQQYSPYSYRNAYARPYSPPSPIEARPPMDEMRYAPGGLEQAPGQLMSDSWGRRPGREYAVPTNQMSQTMPGAAPVAATQGVLAEPNYSGGLGSLMGGVSRQGSDPLPQFDPRINLSPNAFGDPSSASSYAGVPYGQLPVWMRG